METISMNKENCKTNDPHKFVLNLLQRLDLRSSNKHVPFQNLSIYYTWKNIRRQYKNNKLNKKQLQHGMMNLNYRIFFYFVSDIQDYIEYIKKHEALTTFPPIHVFIDRVNKLEISV